MPDKDNGQIPGDSSKRKLSPRNTLNDLTAKEWIPETISVFVQKGLGKGHKDAQIERQHPAPFSFQDIGRLVRFFTKQGERVLDPFCGVASTLKACAVNGREGVGIELNRKYVELSQRRLQDEVDEDLFRTVKQEVIHGDALEVIDEFPDGHFKLVVTSPPYWNILRKIDHKAQQERVANNLDTKYSDSECDLGNIEKYDEFVDILATFFLKCCRVISEKGHLCIVVSDFRDGGRYHMFHSDLAARLDGHGFTLKGITILYQKHKRVFPYGYPTAYVPNIHHQYILILQKTPPPPKPKRKRKRSGKDS